jgi:hypothetical protein
MTKVIYNSYHIARPPMLFGDQVFMKSMFDKLGLEQQIGFKGQTEGAVVTIPLHFTEDYIDNLNADISKLDWVLLVLTANEFGSPSYREIKHPKMKIYLSTPSPYDVADKFIPLGSPSLLEPVKADKDLDFFFAGQVTNERRLDCTNELNKIKGGEILGTKGFGQGYEYSEYVDKMSRAKVIPCPGGPATPDTFRVYEALEIGSIPVLDQHAGVGKFGGDYWKMVLGDHPLKTIDDWSEFPKVLKSELNNYDARQKEISEWWVKFKQDFADDLEKDIQELSTS